MSVETALYPSQLNTAWPLASDMVSEGDDHIRLLKTVDVTTWPNIAGVVAASHIELNYVVGVTSPLQGQINGKGSVSGQTWTGAHVFSGSIAVPTLAQGTSTTGAASTAFVQNEWATRLPNYTGPITASTAELNRMVGVTSGVQSQINTKGAIGGQVWTGTHAFPSTTTIGPLTPTIQGYLATATSDVQAQINGKASKSGEIYTGTHNFTGATVNVATAATGSAGGAAASLDFVNATALSSALPGQAGNAGKVITTNGTNASWSNVLTSYLSGPAGATGEQFPQAQEVVPRAAAYYSTATPMSASPPGTVGFFESTTGGGTDWPMQGSLTVHGWVVETWDRGGVRTVQTATFAMASGSLAQGTQFRRYQVDGVWYPWARAVSDLDFREKVYATNTGVGPGDAKLYYLDPSKGSIHQLTVEYNTYFTGALRGLGDQITLRLKFSGGAWPISFNTNFRFPAGAGFPTYASGQTLTMTFFNTEGSYIDGFIAGVHNP